MKACYLGKILDIDLTKERIDEYLPSDEDLESFIGGSGLAAKIIFDEVDPSIEPFSPENLLIFMTGPLTGTMAPTSSRFTVAAKSPLTNGWGESHAGGFWGVELKRAGFDGIILRGRARDPIYIYLNDGEVEFRDASDIWEHDIYEADRRIKDDIKDQGIRVAAIGTAGARLVKISCIAFDIRPDGPRVAGRCGLGAVMGSKNLKALAVKGSGSIRVADPGKLREYLRRILPSIMSFPLTQLYAAYGTSSEFAPLHTYGDVPIKNFSMGEWSGMTDLRAEAVNKIVEKRKACFNCPIGCWRYVEIRENGREIRGRLMEYEIITSLGSLLMINDPREIAELNYLCNRYGLDAISTGVTIAWLIECYEREGFEEEMLRGLTPRWGDPEFVKNIVEKIGKNEGIGKILGLGVKEASSTIGRCKEFAMHVKGVEMPMHDPRAFKGMGLQYATSNRGADHLYGFVLRVEQGERVTDLGIHERVDRFEYRGKGRIVAVMQDWHEVIESMGICKFLAISPGHLASIYSIATARAARVKELHRKGTRIFTLKRLFNLACGLDGRTDTLPYRVLKEPLKSGGAAGQVVELRPMLMEYYRFRKWDEHGYPTLKCLEELGLLEILSESRYSAYKALLSRIS